MAILSSVAVTRYAARDRRMLFDLIDSQYRVHIHLDWLSIDRLLNDSNLSIWLAWQGGMLIGALATAPPLVDATWIRMAVIHDAYEAETVFPPLWTALRAELRAGGVRTVGLLAQREWVGMIAPLFEMTEQNRIVTLQRSGKDYPPPRITGVRVVPGELEDLDLALAIDHAAFAPIWQLSKQALREAIRLSAYFTLAIADGQPVAYQLATLYTSSGHLARLATLPTWQGRGIGGILIGNLVARFNQRHIHIISVNTQQTNQQSQRLYRQFGFSAGGVDIPVWLTTID